MARIDITSIPNAPEIQPQSLQGAEPVLEGMSKLKQDPMSLDAFSGSAKGMQAVGEGVNQLAAPLSQYADALKKAQTTADMARLDVAKSQWQAGLNNKLQTLPPDQYEQAYRDSIPDLQKTIDGLDISPSAKNKANPEMIRFLGETQIAVRNLSQKQQISNMRADINTASQGDVDNGNYDGAIGRIKESVASHIFSQSEGDQQIQKIQDIQKRQGWQQTINSDPVQSLETLQEDAKSGKSETFKGANPVELARLTETARTEVNRQRMDTMRSVENGIDAGQITTPEQIKAADPKGTLDAVAVQGLNTRMKNENGPNPDKWMQIQGDIASLDPKDPDFQQKWLSIKSDVNQNVGSQWRGSMESQLYQKITQNQKSQGQTVDDKVAAAGFQRIHYLYENGAFGDATIKKNKGTGIADPADMSKQADAYTKAMSMNDALNTAIKNGKIENSYSGVNSWINDQLSAQQKQILGNKLNQPQGGGFWNGVGRILDGIKGDFSPNDPAPSAQEIRSKINGQPSPNQTSAEIPISGKVTSYGYPDDSTSDSQTANGKSAIGKLTPDSLAVSPDVEQKMKDQGIKIGDPVTLHLADGTTVNRTWDDRTASDAQARKLGLKPLRGRFDFNSPAGLHPKDGVAVVGISKANQS